MSDSAPRPRGRPGTAADTRARLISAAVEVFLERGYANTRVQDITNAAGFTTGALYAHFASRMDILAEALLAEGERLVDEMTERVSEAHHGGGGAAARLAETLTSPTDGFDRLALEAITLATRDDEAREKIVPALNRLSSQLTDLVSSARTQGLVDDATDPQANSLLMMSIILGATIIRALDLPRADPDQVHDLFLRLRGTLQPAVNAAESEPAVG